mgnify:CR=1 FL=1
MSEKNWFCGLENQINQSTNWQPINNCQLSIVNKNIANFRLVSNSTLRHRGCIYLPYNSVFSSVGFNGQHLAYIWTIPTGYLKKKKKTKVWYP